MSELTQQVQMLTQQVAALQSAGWFMYQQVGPAQLRGKGQQLESHC